LYVGRLTVPINPQDPPPNQTFTVHDQLAYGFKFPHQCAPYTGPTTSANGGSSAPSSGLCTHWVFLDADDGSVLDDTYEG
jgi:hypothetical protein